MKPPAGEAGFTLIELIISLALFALIAMAGLSLVEALLNIQQRTSARLDRLAELQRAMYVLDNDLTQVSAGPVTGDGTALSFNRPLAADDGQPARIRYQLGAGTLLRGYRGRGLPQGEQRVLSGVGSLRWSFYAPGTGWVDHWPPTPGLASRWPAAVAADIALAPGSAVSGSLRRVTLLPAQP